MMDFQRTTVLRGIYYILIVQVNLIQRNFY